MDPSESDSEPDLDPTSNKPDPNLAQYKKKFRLRSRPHPDKIVEYYLAVQTKIGSGSTLSRSGSEVFKNPGPRFLKIWHPFLKGIFL